MSRIRTPAAIVPGWVILRVTDPQALRHYTWLAWRYADRERHCWPREDELAEELGVSLSTTERSLRILRKADVLITSRTRQEDGFYGRNLYWLPLDDPYEDPREDHHHPSSVTDGQVIHPSNMTGPGDLREQDVSAGREDLAPSVKYDGSIRPTIRAKRTRPNGLDADASRAEPSTASDPDASAGQFDLFGDPVLPSKPDLENHQINASSDRKSRKRSPRAGSTQHSAVDHGDGPAPAQQAVAAWVQAYTGARDGVQATRSQRGQVARSAKDLLAADNPLELVLAAARQAGERGWPDVGRELAQMTARNGNGHHGGNGYTPYREDRSAESDEAMRMAVETGAIFR